MEFTSQFYKNSLFRKYKIEVIFPTVDIYSPNMQRQIGESHWVNTATWLLERPDLPFAVLGGGYEEDEGTQACLDRALQSTWAYILHRVGDSLEATTYYQGKKVEVRKMN